MVNKSNLRSCLGISTFLLAVAGLAQAVTITVGPEAAHDFDTIQAGIDAAVDGDTVLVAPGEYVITEPVTFRGKAITVKSEAGPYETTIRMGTPTDLKRASVVVFEKNETPASFLEGFTISGGQGSWVPTANASGGGGIHFNASSGTVSNCVIVQNKGDYGAGIGCADGASPTLFDCIISENSASVGLGGGVYAWYASAILIDCIISGNSAEADGGGGIACWYGSLVLTRCIILKNTGGYYFGGGVYTGHGSATLNNCIVARNTVALGGGGVACSYWNASLNINNCTIWDNSGGALYGGGGVLCREGSATITNSIIWGNTSAKGHEISVPDPASKLDITYSNVAGGQAEISVEGGCTLNWGEGNIDADPHFVRLGYLDDKGTRDTSDDVWMDGDYHLKSQAGSWDPGSQTWVQDDVTSPCIDARDPMSPIDWESFPNGGFVNMGAYGGTLKASKTYFGEPVCETIVAGDINGDGKVNRADLEIMALHWTDDEPLLR